MTSTDEECGCGGRHGDRPSAPSRSEEPCDDVRFEIAVEPFGPSEDDVARAADALLDHPTVAAMIGHADRRLLQFRIDSPVSHPCLEPARKPVGAVPDSFTATIYDYAENRVIEAHGDLASLDLAAPGDVTVTVLGHQPLPSTEEFAHAVEIVMHDRDLRARLTGGEIATFRPMPPVLVDPESPDGRTDRTLLVGLRSVDPERPWQEIVGVRMFDRAVLRDLGMITPPATRVCEPPPGTDPLVRGGGLTGQCWITVTSGGQTLWRFLAIRPGASSGTNGSGIELRYVDYRDKRVLYQAHVPILNVEYGTDGQQINCGPTYRDWQNAETRFDAVGSPVAPGFILCPHPARTIIDTDSDTGNFAGVAIYVDGPEVVLVSEMQAGWYRYITEWRFHANGTIRPRFGFAGTQNPCTCHLHTHHVYWRLDFDLRTPGHNSVEEFNDPPIVGNNNWHTKQFEIRRPRDLQHKRHWRVRNTMSGESYEIRPGPNDGTRTGFGVGDLWVLRYHPNEIDDGQGFTRDPALSTAHLEKFMTPPESVVDADVVVWYAAHYVHDAGIEVGNWVGPDLVPTRW